jgi:hypothetical protein
MVKSFFMKTPLLVGLPRYTHITHGCIANSVAACRLVKPPCMTAFVQSFCDFDALCVALWWQLL